MTHHATLALAAIALLVPMPPSQANDLHWLGETGQPKDFFPIMTWTSLAQAPAPGGRERTLQGIAECNFTVAGFVQPADLKECEKLGLKAIVQLPQDVAPWQGKWEDASGEVVDDTIKQRIAKIDSSKAIIGYFIKDEPKATMFAGLGKQVAAVKKFAPGMLAYINLVPGYPRPKVDKDFHGAAEYTDYLERFVAEAKPQMISYDDYWIIYSDNGQDTRAVAKYFGNLMEVRRISLKYGIPFWNIVCCNRIRPYTTVPSPANLMLQAYTTLAAGARGLTWYRYHDHYVNSQGSYGYSPIDAAGNRTNTWQYLRTVNQQIKVIGRIMNHLKSTGVFYTDLPTFDDLSPLPPLPGRIVEAVESRSSIKGFTDAKPPIMVGEFEGDDGCDYAMLVNLSLEKSANITLRTRKTCARIEVISAQDGTPGPIDEANGHWLVPGEGVLIKFTPARGPG